MKKNIWIPLQIAWLILAMFTAHNSTLALIGDADYCSGAYCERDNDCALPCYCDAMYFTCMGQVPPKR